MKLSLCLSGSGNDVVLRSFKSLCKEITSNALKKSNCTKTEQLDESILKAVHTDSAKLYTAETAEWFALN